MEEAPDARRGPPPENACDRTYPSYVHLAVSGELEARARRARALLDPCRLCPRECGAARLAGGTGSCGTAAAARVVSYGAHHGEEDCLRGRRGSGTVFFGGCNLGCLFCQNWEISRPGAGRELDAATLAQIFLDLQEIGCHNLNLVTPSHVVPQILEALCLAARAGLRLPLVYNSGGFDAVDTLRLLDGVVDIYMPDVKLLGEEASARYLTCGSYPRFARAALREMHRQTGDLEIDPAGLARRGLLVRHLVMPGLVGETRAVARFLVELSPDTFLNLMDQYRPSGQLERGAGRASFAEIARLVDPGEMRRAVRVAREAGIRRLIGPAAGRF